MLLLADRLKVSRADAYLTVVEAWYQLSLESDDEGIVKGWTPATLEALVDLEAVDLGKTLVDLGLVGAVNDGLMLPAELRRVRGGAADDGRQGRDVSRKARNAEAARRYRRKAKTLGKTLKPSRASSFRSLGKVAGHDVRAVEGEYGVYVVVAGARLGGETFRSFTTGDKSWTLDSVTLVDALPGLCDKWKAIHDEEARVWDTSKRKTLEPSFEAFRDDCARLRALAKSQHSSTAEAPTAVTRHDDGDDGYDASSLSSSDRGRGSDRNSRTEGVLSTDGASSKRHNDAPSSMSSMSSSKEEDIRQDGRRMDDARNPPAADALDQDGRPLDMSKRYRQRKWAGKVGAKLGMDADAVIAALCRDPAALKAQIFAAGLNPATGDWLHDERGRGRPGAPGAIGVPMPEIDTNRLAGRSDHEGVQQAAVAAQPVA